MNNSDVKLINLTPHEITVMWDSGVRRFPSQGVARVDDLAADSDSIDGIPVVSVSPFDIYGLPEEEEGTVFIVSRILAQALVGEREDLVFPFGEIRDDRGRIEAVRSLARFV